MFDKTKAKILEARTDLQEFASSMKSVAAVSIVALVLSTMALFIGFVAMGRTREVAA